MDFLIYGIIGVLVLVAIGSGIYLLVLKKKEKTDYEPLPNDLGNQPQNNIPGANQGQQDQNVPPTPPQSGQGAPSVNDIKPQNGNESQDVPSKPSSNTQTPPPPPPTGKTTQESSPPPQPKPDQGAGNSKQEAAQSNEGQENVNAQDQAPINPAGLDQVGEQKSQEMSSSGTPDQSSKANPVINENKGKSEVPDESSKEEDGGIEIVPNTGSQGKSEASESSGSASSQSSGNDAENDQTEKAQGTDNLSRVSRDVNTGAQEKKDNNNPPSQEI